MNRSTFLISAAAALALSACAERSEDTAEETSDIVAGDAAATGTATPAAAGEMGDAATPTDPQGFVDAAAASDMFEIETGKLAQQKGKSQAVKDFGMMIERDHTKSSAELKTIAGEVGVTPAPQMTAKQKSDLAALQGAGDNFDTLYKQQQVAAHEMALALMQSQAQTGETAPLKAFAAKTAPVIERHLAEARTLP